jgi:hypothetical protein
MKLYFKTKVDINGNIKQVEINFDHKIFARDYKATCWGCDYIEIKRRDYDMLIKYLKENGFLEV